jgi:hypothetical protein
MDLFAFFKFYFYAITGNDKRFKIVNDGNAMFPILITPVVLFIIHMMTSFVVLFYHPSSMVLTYTMPIWIPIILFNMIYANLVRDKFWKDEREKREQEAQARREQMFKEREAERMYNAWREHMRKKLDEERERKERKERIYTNVNKSNQNYTNALRLMGLNGNPSEKEIKSAYKRLAKVHHPDLGGTQANFIKLQKAYDYLMNK